MYDAGDPEGLLFFITVCGRKNALQHTIEAFKIEMVYYVLIVLCFSAFAGSTANIVWGIPSMAFVFADICCIVYLLTKEKFEKLVNKLEKSRIVNG